jgi:uncharacterized protein YcbK (DUF882 family)
VLIGLARQFNLLALPKAGYGFGLGSLLLIAGAGSVHDATALNETRTLSFHHTHSGEDLTVTFKRNGRYDEEALKKLNHFLRDWRSQDQTTMDRHLFDILWEVYRDVDGKKPIQIISAYRSPATNSMLRRRSSGVARFSQHMLGHAMDFYIPDVPLEHVRAAGLRQQRGGVGFYPTSGSPFVHLDTGSVRHWPRMTQEQLAKVFPDGRTVHLPSNGGPMKGYELARADIERRGNGDNAATTSKMPNLFASWFKGSKATTEEDDEGASAPARNEKPGSTSVAAATPAKSADPVPTPRAKPQVAATLQLASADAQIVPAAKARPEAMQVAQASAENTEPKPQTPADIINSRGFWDDPPANANQPTPAQVAGLRARQALAAAQGNAIWMRVMMLAPSASSAMSTTVLGDTARHHPLGAQCRCRSDRGQHRGLQGRAGSGPRGRNLGSPRRRAGQRDLDAGHDAGAKRKQRNVDDGARRYRDDPDAELFRQAADCDRHELLGRSDDGHDLRPLLGIGDREAFDPRAAYRRAALDAGIVAGPTAIQHRRYVFSGLMDMCVPATASLRLSSTGAP